MGTIQSEESTLTVECLGWSADLDLATVTFVEINI
jgi:hypothetical protein